MADAAIEEILISTGRAALLSNRPERAMLLAWPAGLGLPCTVPRAYRALHNLVSSKDAE
jgi:hypothetical protein